MHRSHVFVVIVVLFLIGVGKNAPGKETVIICCSNS